MKNRIMDKSLIICALVMLSSCKAEGYNMTSGEQCIPFVELYLSFHDSMTNNNWSDKPSILLDALHVHPEDLKSPKTLNALVTAYVEHENEILEISEYHVTCDPKREYAVVWYKISDVDPRFSRLYVVIDEGKIGTLSKELTSSIEKIDSGKLFLSITGPEEKEQ